MYYIYRFIDKNKNIIYVGKSKQVLEQRFRGHTHLPDECYASVHKIEYITCSTETDMSIKEIYYINKYKNENGYFNLLDLSELPKSVEFNDKWKMYRGPLPKHFSKSLNVKKNYSTEKDIRYNRDGSVDQRQPHKTSGKSSYVDALNKDEINKIIDHLIVRVNTAPTDTKRFVWFRNLMFFVLCMNLPLKTEDLLMLKYKDVFNKKNKIIPIELKLNRFHKDEILNIPLRDICKQLLYKYCELLDLDYTNNAEDYLFKSREGDGPVSSRSIWRIVSESAAEVGIKKNVGTESFRKSYGLNVYKTSKNKIKALQFLGEIWGRQRESQLIKYLNLAKDEVDFDFYFGETFTLGEIDFSRIKLVKNNYFIPRRLTNQTQKTKSFTKEEVKKIESKSTLIVSESKNNKDEKQHKHRFSKAIKVEIINKYLSGESSQKALAKEYDVSVTSINRWVNDYQKYGDRFLD